MAFRFTTKKVFDNSPLVDVLGCEPDGGETELILPQYTHSIGDGAFRDCTDITSIRLPKTLTDIGREAFKGCTSLKEVTMPESGKYCDISCDAFEGCTSLEKIVLHSARFVFDGAFHNCTKLKEIDVGDHADISRYAVKDTLWYKEYEGDFVILGGVLLEYRGHDKNVTVPEGVWMIGNDAFMNCNFVETVVLPQSTERIDYLAFYRCKALRSITLPDGLSEILPCAFVDCMSLTSLRIPDSVTLLGDQIFDGCSRLESITMPLSAVADNNIKYVLKGCPSIKAVTFSDSGETVDLSAEFLTACSVLLRYNGRAKEISVPEGITKLGCGAFAGCDFIESVTIPDGVTEIGDNAFANCKNLRSVRLPDSLVSLGSCAFGNCSALISGIIPTGIRFIGSNPFYGCTSLEKYEINTERNFAMNKNTNDNTNNNLLAEQVITKYTGTEKDIFIPEGVLWIGDGAFKDNKDIVSVRLPKTLTYLGEEAFSGCTSLREIHMDPRAPFDSIGQGAFKGCTALENLSIGGIEYIGDESFMNCTALRTVIVSGGCEEVGFSAFENCTSLESVILPDSVKEICGSAFKNCPRLKDVFLPEGEDIDIIIDECFIGCKALERRLRCLRQPDTENIPGVIENETLICFDDTYTDCVVIPSCVKNIAAGAFKSCNNLAAIIIPDTVEDIEFDAFSGCPNLEDVIIPDGSDIVTQYMLEGTKWHSDNENGFFILGGTLLEYNGSSRDIIVPPSVKRISEEALAELCSSPVRSISLPSTMTEMPDLPDGNVTAPLVSVYKVNPDRAV